MKTDSPHARRFLLVAAGIYLAVIGAIVWLRAESSSDFRDFWRTSEHFRITGEIRDDLGVHNYLPAFTILMTPLSLLPLRPAIVLFTILSLGALAATLGTLQRMLSRGADAPDQNGPGGSSRGLSPAITLALALMLAYVTSCAVLGALGLILLALSVWAWRLAERGRDLTAGVVLATATVIKLLPGLLIVHYVLTGRWRVVLGFAGGGLVIGLGLPLMTFGWSDTLRLHDELRQRISGQSAWATIHEEKPLKANFSNIASPIVLRRLMSPVNAAKSDDEQLTVNVVSAPPGAIWTTYLFWTAGVLLSGTAASLLAGSLARRRAPTASDAERWAVAAWFPAMLLTSPLVWTHYLPLALPALCLICDRALGMTRKSAARGALLIWLAAVVLLAWPAARAAGAPLWATAGLWAVCLAAVWERYRADAGKNGKIAANQRPPAASSAARTSG